MNFEYIQVFITLAGLIIGLGAVTVIDVHGFLARNSSYWTEATTRAHKVTKPLIWTGIVLYAAGSFSFYSQETYSGYFYFTLSSIVLMVINGLFLSFYISPILLTKEKQNKASELLSKELQAKITASFVLSFLLWWSQVLVFSIALTQ